MLPNQLEKVGENMETVIKPKFNYTGMEREARKFLINTGGYKSEEVALMTCDEVSRAIVKWCETNNYHVVQEGDCVTLAPNDAKYYYLSR